MNDRGDVAGRYVTEDGRGHGHVLNAADEFRTIDFPNAVDNEANGINNRGVVVGRYVIAGTTYGYRWDDGEFTRIDIPGAVFTWPHRISPRGDITGPYDTADGRRHGFLLSRHGPVTTFDVPEATATWPSGLNPQGDIVGNYTDADGRTHGFLWIRGERDDHGDSEDGADCQKN